MEENGSSSDSHESSSSLGGFCDAEERKVALEEYWNIVQMTFGSEDECYRFYNKYANDKGFSIRKDIVRRERKIGDVFYRRSNRSFSVVGVLTAQVLLATGKKIPETDTYVDLALDMVYKDMVFIPTLIEYKKMKHWVLFVVNNKKKEFQVLDSLWSLSMYKKKMEGLKQMVQNLRELIRGRVPEASSVDKWNIKQYHNIPKQADGCSCGVYDLKLIVTWDGSRVNPTFTQDDIDQSRKHLLVGVMLSELNTIQSVKDEVRALL